MQFLKLLLLLSRKTKHKQLIVIPAKASKILISSSKVIQFLSKIGNGLIFQKCTIAETIFSGNCKRGGNAVFLIRKVCSKV